MFLLGIAGGAAAQQAKQEPPIRVNILNVCAPSPDEQKEIAGALARIPRQLKFGADYEVSRGHTTIEGPGSDWVRVRREYAADPVWRSAQFSFSTDPGSSRETLVFFARDARNVTQLAVEDRVTPSSAAATVLAADTPASRISLERVGKPHLVVARCPDSDQSALETLFRTASEIMTAYRAGLNARQIIPGELGRLQLGDEGGRRPPRVKHMGPRR